ncbi:hypothetical protein G4B88_018592 [Cannabis sativa]|uniref:SUI1 domain-containing protein n=1 Tax=Cannabis sativa TaxID=3483 RepID=A0A7J6HGK9_CANSA|nr:hypothetical protein G4B88_018592 [Cannabis sativa]
MSELEHQVPSAFDPFADASADDSGAGSKEYVHVRVQQRNGRKSLTTVQGLKKDYSYNKILKDLKKEFCCNGTVVQDPELGQVIQLQGDQRKNVSTFLVQAGIVKKEHIKIHEATCPQPQTSTITTVFFFFSLPETTNHQPPTPNQHHHYRLLLLLTARNNHPPTPNPKPAPPPHDDKTSSIVMANKDKERDRELLIPVADSPHDEPSSSSSSHHPGREFCLDCRQISWDCREN